MVTHECAWRAAVAKLAIGMAVMGGGAWVARAADAQVTAPVSHTLIGTYYDAYNGSKATSCAAAGCTAWVNVATVSIPCTGAVGAACTIELDVAGLAEVGYNGGSFPNGNVGNYQFTFDGHYPAATGPDGIFPFGITGPQASGFMVTYQVKNTSLNQKHVIVVNIGCLAGSSISSGCNAQISDPSLVFRVMRP
jgi:hypothetical protein